WHKLSASRQNNETQYLHCVARLWRWLPEPVCLDALRHARRMRDPRLLEAMLPHAPPALKAELAREAVSAARRLPRRSGREALIRAAGIVWLKLFGLTSKRPWQQKLRSKSYSVRSGIARLFPRVRTIQMSEGESKSSRRRCRMFVVLLRVRARFERVCGR